MNSLFTLGSDLINFTSRTLFLTGKAGTGKTTFLKHIKEHTHKNCVVVAPTGVAAINAGGVTMHSFFQLPFIPFLPGSRNVFAQNDHHLGFVDRNHLLAGIRFAKSKIDVMMELELLIVDEVSMLRADMLDAMDTILRSVRKQKNVPFGGVQVLFIGDLHQLPPVVSDEEWAILKDTYASPFFFSAQVYAECDPLFIELKKIYRQNDERFIALLNNLRNNSMQEEDYLILENRFSNAPSADWKDSITLTTHNRIAEEINSRELKNLQQKQFTFKGIVEGEFPEKAFPVDLQLVIKEGAQVMFIRNDSSIEKRYFNGKLATIKSIHENEITVILSGSKEELVLEQETWKNIKYSKNKESGKIDENPLGSFTQFPIRLAWAITIHKSQGLTFEKAMIDAGASFAAGQVYVALSRCRSLEGLLLLSKINAQSIKSDDRIVEFLAKEISEKEILEILENEKPKVAAQILIKTFNLQTVLDELLNLLERTWDKKFDGQDEAMKRIEEMTARLKEQFAIAKTFQEELEKKLSASPMNLIWIEEKVKGAKNYFGNRIKDELIVPLQKLRTSLKSLKRSKAYLLLLYDMELLLVKKLKDIHRVQYGSLGLEVPMISIEAVKIVQPKKKLEKGASILESLNLHSKGKSISEISILRNLAEGTIESHLCECVAKGILPLSDLINSETLESIQAVFKKSPKMSTTESFHALGGKVSYAKIRLVWGMLIQAKENLIE